MKSPRELVVLIVTALSLSLIGMTARSQSVEHRESSMAMLEGKLAADGAIVLQKKGCTNCHTFDNWGGNLGPDLGSNRMRGKGPAALAAAMWNHSPAMWRLTGAGSVPAVSQPEAAALYAFFYSRLYFEDVPHSPSGEDLFKSRCAGCHDLEPQTASPKAGPAVTTWGTIKDPIALIGRMWNHSTDMLDQTLRQGKSWPQLSGQDTRNLVGYLWRLPQLVPAKELFSFGDDVQGRQVFGQRCEQCHTLGRAEAGRVDLTRNLRRTTMLQFAASMWNHAPKMKQKYPGTQLPVLTETETRDLVTYAVIGRAFEESGDPRRGEIAYRSKRCFSCHEDGAVIPGAPVLKAGSAPFTAVRMASVVWSHGPAMQDAMNRAGVRWPRFEAEEMLDLLAYLSERNGQ